MLALHATSKPPEKEQTECLIFSHAHFYILLYGVFQKLNIKNIKDVL
jgi:hypothetical protein